ncbi:hypothetical protein O6H91_08G009600 [Diphasiastrum complanatum]|uniref:Uncharacterized protein n=2 Tax=Diphasiastrum complanatum TaxID=34168 RepID=A0ACC2CUW4_DIPCM|nr:hypothetical protein O6H91_09G079100 [Diphasiastrum complanatum]KAJ7545770.1 hypothetical protein O6H91_08G009600 [Diphasiastrum complanatum]
MLDNSKDSTNLNFIWLPTLKVWGFLAPPHRLDSSDSSKDVASASSPSLGASIDKNSSVMSQNLMPAEALYQNTSRVSLGQSTDLSPEDRMQSSGKSFLCELDQELVCPICLGTVDDGRRAVLWGCMHRFCVDCLEAWSKLRRSCPLCKAEYFGWNQGGTCPGEIEKRLLPPLKSRPSLCLEDYRPSIAESEFSDRTSTSSRGLGRLVSGRESVRNTLSFRSRLRLQQLAQARSTSRSYKRHLPLPRQRFFGPCMWPTTFERDRVAADSATERVLRWRGSIYKRRLKAVPFQKRKTDDYQSTLGDPDANLRAERRLGPWIHRELQAVLGNSDPSLLVHRVLSLWISYKTKLAERMQEIVDSVGENTFTMEARRKARIKLDSQISETAIEELKGFLADKGPLFWHELRCFAESPFTLNTYDSIVIYSRQEQ